MDGGWARVDEVAWSALEAAVDAERRVLPSYTAGAVEAPVVRARGASVDTATLPGFRRLSTVRPLPCQAAGVTRSPREIPPTRPSMSALRLLDPFDCRQHRTIVN